MQEFSDKTAPHQIPFEAFGLELRFCTNSPELMERVQSILPPGWRRIPRSTRQIRIGLLEGDNEIYSIHYDSLTDDGESRVLICIHDAPGREYALTMLETQLSTIIATESRDFVTVHAGVVADGDRAIVIPGMSFSGKTTLVLALVQAGAVYYSDEYAMFHEDGRVHPYARQLSSRPPNRDAVDLKVEHLGGVAGTEPLPIGMVILTRFRPGGDGGRVSSRPALPSCRRSSTPLPPGNGRSRRCGCSRRRSRGRSPSKASAARRINSRAFCSRPSAPPPDQRATRSCSATLEDRGGGLEKPASLLLEEPKSPCGENLL